MGAARRVGGSPAIHQPCPWEEEDARPPDRPAASPMAAAPRRGGPPPAELEVGAGAGSPGPPCRSRCPWHWVPPSGSRRACPGPDCGLVRPCMTRPQCAVDWRGELDQSRFRVEFQSIHPRRAEGHGHKPSARPECQGRRRHRHRRCSFLDPGPVADRSGRRSPSSEPWPPLERGRRSAPPTEDRIVPRRGARCLKQRA